LRGAVCNARKNRHLIAVVQVKHGEWRLSYAQWPSLPRASLSSRDVRCLDSVHF
jgi:hypothetical protein